MGGCVLHASMGRVVLQMEGASFLSVGVGGLGRHPSFNGGGFRKNSQDGGGSPPLKPSIEINNNYSVYIVFESEAVLRKSKESNNYGIKVQVKRALLLKNILFCHQCTEGALPQYFKINAPLFCFTLFFKEYLNPQVNKWQISCQLPPPFFRINLRGSPCVFL